MKNNTTFIITGANGYVGKHIVKYILNNTNFDIIAVDIKKGLTSPRISWEIIDIFDDNLLNNVINKVKNFYCIHLAWQDGFIHNSTKHIENLSSQFKFIKNIIDSDCKSIAVMGTMHEVGYFEGCINSSTPCNPLSLYGIAKNALREATLLYAQNTPQKVKWLRGYYFTGDDENNNSIFAKILQFAKEGKSTFPFTTGINKYDFIDIDKLAEQIVKATLQNEYNGIINCCSGEPVSLKDKVEEFIKIHNLDIRPEYGVFPARKYDSPAVWGDASIINKIMES